MREKNAGDRRVLRTKGMLSEALFALIIERGYESITVQDIAERANIGRATFYLHYHDKEQLLEDSLLTLMDELTKYMEQSPALPSTYRELSVRFFRHVAEQHELYRAMLKSDGPPFILSTLSRNLVLILQHRVLKPLFDESKQQIDPELLAMHAAGSLLFLAMWWLNHNLTPPAEELGAIFMRLVAPGVDIVLDLHNGQWLP